MQFPGTAKRIHNTYPSYLRPKLRLIAVIREPVSLIVNLFDYFHEFDRSMVNKTFEHWMGPLATQLNSTELLPRRLRSAVWIEQLTPYWAYFSPINVLMLDMNDVINNFPVALHGIAAFTGAAFAVSDDAMPHCPGPTTTVEPTEFLAALPCGGALEVSLGCGERCARTWRRRTPSQTKSCVWRLTPSARRVWQLWGSRCSEGLGASNAAATDTMGM